MAEQPTIKGLAALVAALQASQGEMQAKMSWLEQENRTQKEEINRLKNRGPQVKEYHTLGMTLSEASQKLLDIVASEGNANNMVVCLDQLNVIPKDHQKRFVLQDSWSM